MATIKSYTDIEQSKKLAGILPLESADMFYQYVLPKSVKIKHNPEIGNPINALKWYNKGYTTSGKEPITLDEYCVPCWSLAALLGVIPQELFGGEYIINITERTNYKWIISYEPQAPDEISSYIDASSDNLIDCCVKIILKLKDRNIL